MSVRLFRRVSSLMPLPITTVSAPVLSTGHVDVTAEGQPWHTCGTCGAGWQGRHECPRPVSSPPPQVRQSTLTPPTYTPGVCWHHVHVEYLGERIGLQILDEGRAAWLRCQHVNVDGR